MVSHKQSNVAMYAHYTLNMSQPGKLDIALIFAPC